MHGGGISIRGSGFKSVASEFILGPVPTDKCGFAVVVVLELCLEVIPIHLLPGQPFRASLPLQLGCVEKWPPYTLPFQPVHPDCNCPEKNNAVCFISFWDFVDENTEATGTGAIFLSSLH